MFKPSGSFNKTANKSSRFSIEQPKSEPKPAPKRAVQEDYDDEDDERPRQRAKKKKTAPQAPKVALTPAELKEIARAERVRSRALVPINPDTHQPIVSNKAVKFLETRFKGKADIVIEQLEAQDTDGAVALLTRSLLQMLVDLMPLAENAVRESRGTRGIHAMNQMVTSIRETLTDLQALRDKGLLGHRIVERTIRPAFMDIGSQIVLGFVDLESRARTSMNQENFLAYQENLKEVKRSIAQYLEAQYREIQEQVIASLS